MAASAGNNCVKQLSLLRRDLDRLCASEAGAGTAPLRGAIGATLTTLAAELEHMESLARAESNAAKREKHAARLEDLRAQERGLREAFREESRRRDEEAAARSRHELLGRRPAHNATPDNPYAGAGAREPVDGRQEGNLREAGALDRVGNALDEFIESGLASLGDLRDQSSALKGTQRRLRDIAVGLGLSGDTIRRIERRTRGDKWIFYGGCLFTLVCFFFILRWFG